MPENTVEVVKVMEFSVWKIFGHFTQTEGKALERAINLILYLNASNPPQTSPL